MKKQIIIFAIAFLSACQNSSYRDLTLSSVLPIDEKQSILPNELFIGIADRKSEQELEQILNKNGLYLFSTNEEGDTPLGVAIKFYNKEGALFLAKQMSPKHYLHQNLNGEGYLFLASQKGHVTLIKLLAKNFYESQSEFLTDYEFDDLDMKTNQGERALHVAQNSVVAEALETEYNKGFLEVPYREFQFLRNNDGQSFLHTAIRDRNSDLLRWGVNDNCHTLTEWQELSWYEKILPYFWEGYQRYAGYVGFVNLDWDNLINTTDNQELSPINLSAKNLFLEGIQILSTCQWTNYLLEDENENLPLQNFLLSLDPLVEKHDEELKSTFTLLTEKESRLTVAVKTDHINSTNKKGNSSLHISAKLADPFFYNYLKQYGNEEQKNTEGKTAREIFELKHGKKTENIGYNN